MAGHDRDQRPAGRKLERRIAELFEKGKGLVEPVAGTRQMTARKFEHQIRSKPPQAVAAAVQQAQFPPFDVGFDEIEAIEPERRDDRVEGGQGNELLRDCVPRVFGRSEMGEAKAEAAAALDRQSQYPQPRAAPSAIGRITTLVSPCTYTTLRRIERA